MKDYHIHLGLGKPDPKHETLLKYEDTKLNTAYNNLLMYKKYDITHLRDGGDRNMIALKLKTDAKSMGINLLSSGRALCKADKYGKYFGIGIDTISDLKKELQLLASLNVDYIKVILTDIINLSIITESREIFFGTRERQYISDFAHNSNIPLMIHVNSVEGIKAAIEMKPESLEHCFMINDYCIDSMLANNISWTPTISPFGNSLRYNKSFPGWDMNIVKFHYESQCKMVKLAHDKGLKINIGSDSGSSLVPHGQGSYDEKYFVENAING